MSQTLIPRSDRKWTSKFVSIFFFFLKRIHRLIGTSLLSIRVTDDDDLISRLIIDYHIQSFFHNADQQMAEKNKQSFEENTLRFTDNVRMKISFRSSAKRIKREVKKCLLDSSGLDCLAAHDFVVSGYLNRATQSIFEFPVRLLTTPSYIIYPMSKAPNRTFFHSVVLIRSLVGLVLIPKDGHGHVRRRTSRITLPIHRVRPVDWPSSLLHHIIELREKNVITLFVCSLPLSCDQSRSQEKTEMVPERCVA